MKSRLLAVAFVTLSLTASSFAADTTNTIRYTWVVTSCETWNCAASALILANGEPSVIAVPTTDAQSPWLVLRRVEEGSVYIPETESFGCEVFGEVASATSHYLAMDSCRSPMVLSVPDGRAVVISLNQCGQPRRRAVR